MCNNTFYRTEYNKRTTKKNFPESKILGVLVSRRMRALVYMVSRDKVDMDAFNKGIQYALEKWKVEIWL